MEINQLPIFQTDSPLVRSYYERGANFKVEYSNEPESDASLCVIYFSSNELYYPNVEATFDRTIVKRDKYEWRNSKFPGAAKHIFVRDLQKQWYIEGINSKVNTPEKLAEQLKSEADGYRVYAIGSSAGGYAAMVYGSLLGAERVYAFNAQLDLTTVVNKSTNQIDPLLFKYSDTERSRFFRVDNLINEKTIYFYFQSCLSCMDKEQFAGFNRKERLTRIGFKTANHGFPFFRHNLPYMLSLSVDQLKELGRSEHHPFLFSVGVDGFFRATYLVIEAILKRIKKKMYDERTR